MTAIREYRTEELVALLPVPAQDANKYTRGTLSAVVGSELYPGAACLAAGASQRMGAGYTEVFTTLKAAAIVHAYRPSIVVRSQSALEVTSLPPCNSKKPHAYLIGSGFEPQDTRCAKLVFTLLKHAACPILVDGGGLAALATPKGQRLLKRRFILGLPTVLTPHEGEAARLAQAFELPICHSSELSKLLSLASGALMVIKGPETFVSDGEQIVRIGSRCAALAKAGTGDVLAGMIGGLLAQGIDSFDAAVLGAELHGSAGQLAAKHLTEIAVIAEDVIDFIPHAISALADSL